MASKNTPAAIISGAGWLMQLASGLVKGLLARGWDNERIHALVTDKGKADMERVIDALVNALAEPVAPSFDYVANMCSLRDLGRCRLEVDYTKSLSRMIAAGKYDLVNNNITQEHFPHQHADVVKWEGKLFNFNCTVSSEDVIAQMKKEDFEPADTATLCAFGEQFPEMQRQFPIIALGQPWKFADGNRKVGYLGRSGSARVLRLNHFEGGWSAGVRFLAVRDLPAQASKASSRTFLPPRQ